MKPKTKIKLGIDFGMTLLLLALMAYQVVGEKLHEWLGAAMLVLFIAHHLLNLSWYRNLGKGRYGPVRVLSTVLDFAVLAALLALGYSGIVLSRHVFAFLPINGGMALARVLHLAGSYWGFVLMSLHLGLHGGMMLGLFRRWVSPQRPPALAWGLRLLGVVVALYGAFCFIQADIFSYMFLQNEFAFFDFEKSAVLVFAEYGAMMAAWVCVGYYVAKALGKLPTSSQKKGDKL